MAQTKRGRKSKDFKFKIALEAVQGQKTVSKIAEENGIHPEQVDEWKQQLLEKGSALFSGATQQDEKSQKHREKQLINTIGEQQLHINFLKKKLGIDRLEIDD